MSCVNVHVYALTDKRFARLAALLGLVDGDHARGKVEHLWMACTLRGETDLPQWLVEEYLGERGPEALIESELARWSRGRGDSNTRRLYICGARGRTEWYQRNQEQSSKAGKARAAKASRVAGKFTSDVAGANTSANPKSESDPKSESKAKSEEQRETASPPARRTARGTKPPKPVDENRKQAIEAYFRRYESAYSTKPTFTGKQGKAIDRLLKAHGLPEFLRRLEILYTSPPTWLKPPYDLGTLESQFDKLVQPSNGQTSIRVGRVEPHTAEAYADGEVSL